MPAYKDGKTGKWYCKFNYKDWLGERKTKFKRGFATRKQARPAHQTGRPGMGAGVSDDGAGRHEHGAGAICGNLL